MFSCFLQRLGTAAASALLFALGLGCNEATVSGSEQQLMTTHKMTFQGRELHYLEAEFGEGTEPTILLLHGASFSSQTWADLGTLEVLAGAGHHVIALDLPGFGQSTGPSPENPAAFLDRLLDQFGVNRIALLSPSMSGAYAIPFLLAHPERVSHFLPVAPVGIQRNLDALRLIEVPTLALWGGEDRLISTDVGRQLTAAMPNAELRVFPAAPHPCYLEATEAFHRAVLDFLAD
jgi:pimeloyl-ACP methyl ester carboxylesterase